MEKEEINAALLILLFFSSFSVSNADLFAKKMSHYYEFELLYQLYYFENGWWGATVREPGGCTDTVYLSDQFYGELGEGPLWKGVLAHEWAHVSQGARCVGNEDEADWIALRMLAKANEWPAVFRWIEYLEDVKKWDPNYVWKELEHARY